MKSKSKKPTIGDVFEVKTSRGFAYIQFSHVSPDDEIPLIRVLPGIHEKTHGNISALVQERELYYTSYTLEHAIKAGAVVWIAHQPVPPGARKFPVMRQRGERGWFIGDASIPLTVEGYRKLRYVAQLSPEEKKLSIRKIASPAALVADLDRGWTPEKDEFLNQLALKKKRAEGSQLSSKREFLDHYFYFSKEDNAHAAARELRTKGWFAESRRAADGESWLVISKQPTEQLSEIENDELRDMLEELAMKFNGEYDGWGMAV